MGGAARAADNGRDWPKPVWLDDYAEAMSIAERDGKMMLVFFYERGRSPLSHRFESTALADPGVRWRLARYVLARIPVDTTIRVQGRRVVLLRDPAFAEMQGREGIAIIDLAHRGAPYYGSVVSTFPLTPRYCYTAEQTAVILDLPAGTLTQRTLIYAIRTHPDHPASANGDVNPDLALEAELHSAYQARMRSQGHHRWGFRFRRILALLPGGLTPREVCAESWPGESMLDAAVECVRSWRSSSGHWSAVRSPHTYYGYDMKRGSNGVWYATGIFAARG